MDIVSVINYKGGVGKTTVTANLAGELAYRGKKVLLLDMDAQASLTFSFFTPDYWSKKLEKHKTIKNWFDSITEEIPKPALDDLVCAPKKVNDIVGGEINLIPSHLGLINVDLELATLLGGVNMTQTKKNYIKVHGKLREDLNKFGEEKEYDIILIDCPPNFNIVTKNAIIASDTILIPAKPDYLSTLGIDYLQKNLKSLLKDFNEYAEDLDNVEDATPETLGVVFTMVQIYDQEPIIAQKQYISQTSRLGIPVFDTYFRENKTIFANAPQDRIPVVLNDYAKGTHSDVVNELSEFVDEFESLV